MSLIPPSYSITGTADGDSYAGLGGYQATTAMSLSQQVANLEKSLSEAYAEIGRLHQELRRVSDARTWLGVSEEQVKEAAQEAAQEATR